MSPALESIRLKAFGGWKVDQGTTQLHARNLRGKGAQKKNSNKVSVRSLTSASFVLPARYGTGVAYHCIHRGVAFPNSQSTRGTSVKGCSTMFTETSMLCGAVMKMRQVEKSAPFIITLQEE